MQKDDAWDAYGVILATMYDSKTGTYTPLPKASDPTPAVYQTYYAWKQAQRQLEATKESVVRQVYEKYYAVLQAASGLELKRLELKSADLALRAAEARQAVGMETALSLAAVRAQRDQVLAAVRQAENEREQAWQGLALCLGKPATWRAELVDRPAYSALAAADPEAEITRIVEESPAVQAAQYAVDLKRDTYGMSADYKYDRLALANAYDNLAAAREKLTQSLRSAYQSIKLLETSYTNALAAVESAREALRVNELLHQVGLATEADVVAARVNLAKAEDGLLSLAAQHELTVMTFYKPWSAGSGAAGTGS
jgi:outer membrane protein TolC